MKDQILALITRLLAINAPATFMALGFIASMVFNVYSAQTYAQEKRDLQASIDSLASALIASANHYAGRE